MAAMEFVFYYFTPSTVAAVIFTVLFGLSSLLHFYQLVRTRTWFMIPFLIGAICKSGTYCFTSGDNADREFSC
jgi:uncharacterized membrane protein